MGPIVITSSLYYDHLEDIPYQTFNRKLYQLALCPVSAANRMGLETIMGEAGKTDADALASIPKLP
ncbi:hypothetical protein [Streptococcus equi]|uniref:hypothetical protein n=1 Tax=Streptococcus equi TaxID=1336 RepID=UPI001E464760|nr:hypothetical protein [Streptococcus equi]